MSELLPRITPRVVYRGKTLGMLLQFILMMVCICSIVFLIYHNKQGWGWLLLSSIFLSGVGRYMQTERENDNLKDEIERLKERLQRSNHG